MTNQEINEAVLRARTLATTEDCPVVILTGRLRVYGDILCEEAVLYRDGEITVTGVPVEGRRLGDFAVVL